MGYGGPLAGNERQTHHPDEESWGHGQKMNFIRPKINILYTQPYYQVSTDDETIRKDTYAF